ncbi:MAG: DUF4342 domain-containing protein [Firmicutes bacterium]|nr:DUF4342 domain-containing protein [Bacillota bacterium]
MEKLEKIEKLRERAQVSYEEAREACEWAEGDLLEALIYLEKQGKVQPPPGGGYHSSERRGDDEEQSQREKEADKAGSNSVKEALEKIWKFCAQMIKKGNNTSFEVLKNREHMASFPVTVLVLLLIFAPWVTLPLMIIGLFFGFHYQFVAMDD